MFRRDVCLCRFSSGSSQQDTRCVDDEDFDLFPPSADCASEQVRFRLGCMFNQCLQVVLHVGSVREGSGGEHGAEPVPCPVRESAAGPQEQPTVRPDHFDGAGDRDVADTLGPAGVHTRADQRTSMTAGLGLVGA